jgi:hypothetical protein
VGKERTGQHHKQPPPDHSHPYEIVPHLYISGHPDHTHDFMSKGIHAIIDLEGDIDTSIPQAEQQEDTTLYMYWPIFFGLEVGTCCEAIEGRSAEDSRGEWLRGLPRR